MRDAQGASGGVRGTSPEAHKHAGRARPHEVQGGGVGGRAADDDGDVELVDEALEVEGFGPGADMLGRDGRPADDEQVNTGVEHGAPVGLGVLRAERSGDGDACVAQFPEPLGDELRANRLGVDLLHPGRGVGRVELGDLVQEWLGVVVAGPEPLEVQDRQPAEATERDGGRRRHHRVHRRPHDRDVEVIASICHATDTSSGSRVRREGTTAISSKE